MFVYVEEEIVNILQSRAKIIQSKLIRKTDLPIK